ncbi:hypothetical protein T01_3812 [Trichinella spiralis]|uniref:Uncharacterized protein n=1 Tax=Trichinella spiralis TaxID=6334 RepID=A0A0V0Z3T3_TRISP|nr:hypothetical protein T01_3812 [Trichinella spiralis]
MRICRDIVKKVALFCDFTIFMQKLQRIPSGNVTDSNNICT